MKAWLKGGLIIISIIFLVLGIYLLISSISYFSKESKINKLGVGMPLEEFERVLGEPVYGGKYCKVTSAEEFKEKMFRIYSLNEGAVEDKDLKECLANPEECFFVSEIIRTDNTNERFNCFKKYPDTKFITNCGYEGNPKPILSEDHFELYSNDKNIVCAIDRYGLGI
jgi:hypothetical protein